MEFEPGQKVLIEATVIHVYHPDRDESWQALGLNLTGTGQSLQTSVKNVRPLSPEEEAEDEEQAGGEKAKRPAKDKSQRPAQNKGLSHSSFKAAVPAGTVRGPQVPSEQKPAGKAASPKPGGTVTRESGPNRNVEPGLPEAEAVRNAEVSEQES